MDLLGRGGKVLTMPPFKGSAPSTGGPLLSADTEPPSLALLSHGQILQGPVPEEGASLP